MMIYCFGWFHRFFVWLKWTISLINDNNNNNNNSISTNKESIKKKIECDICILQILYVKVESVIFWHISTIPIR